jgi:TetR/AcrR family transcriptional regulator, mexJK operon transcriptional repressor
MPARNTPKSAQTRARALLEAERLYSSGGYDAINLQTIAEAVGVSKAALFYHFDGKQALFVALLETMLERYSNLIEIHMRSKGSSELRFLALSLALSNRPMFDAFRFLRSEQRHLSPEQRDDLRRSCTALLFRPIKQAFALALERQELRQVDVGMASDLFLGFCVLTSSMRSMEYGALSETRHKQMFAMFWHGLASD